MPHGASRRRLAHDPQGHPGRRRAWRAAAPTPPPHWSRSTRCSSSASARETLLEVAAVARQRRPVRARTAARRSATTAAPSSPPRWCAAPTTGCSSLADGGPLDPGGLPRVRPAARGRRRRRAARFPTRCMVGAARRATRSRSGAALTTTCSAAAVSLRPQLAQVLVDREEYGALGGVVSGQRPDVRVPRPRRRARARPRRGVHRVRACAAPSSRAHGPGRRRARVVDQRAAALMPPVTYVALENVSKALGTRTLLDGVTVGDHRGRPHRRRRPQRRRQDHARPRRSPGSSPPTPAASIRAGRHHHRPPRAGRRPRPRGDAARGRRRRPGRARVGRRRPGARRARRPARQASTPPAYGDGLDTVVGTMSGGERRRAALARLLVDDPDLLVLDEPTNHLDVEAVAWLAAAPAPRRGALVAVTHDRWFLDAVATETWEVVDGARAALRRRLRGVRARARPSARGRRQSSEERRQNLLRKELAWLRRGAPARTSKPKFRIDAANELIADEPPPRDRLALEQFATARLGKQVYDLEDVSLAPAPRAPEPSSPPDLAARAPATASACSGPTAWARRRCCACSPPRTTALSTRRTPPTCGTAP